jgi:anti-anti-sigma regulatory factor
MAKISEKKLNFQTIVFIDGDIDESGSVEELERIMYKLLVEGEDEIILNIENARTITPGGLGTILKLYKLLRDSGGCLYTTPRKGEIKFIFEKFNLDELLPEYIG